VPEDPTYPGEYVDESASRVKPIEGVDTSGAAEPQGSQSAESVDTPDLEEGEAPKPIPGVPTSSGLEPGQPPKRVDGVPTSNAPGGRGRFGFLSRFAALAGRGRRPPSP
jgi:hypothetical protein